MRVSIVEASRAFAAFLVILVFTLAPLFGVLYGTTSALNIGGFTMISPLEWVLLNLGAGTIMMELLVPGLVVVFVIILFGRFFCGWICPVGIILDQYHRLTPKKNSKTLGALWKNREKYIILLAVLAASLLFGFTAPYLYSPPGIVYRTITYYALRGIIGVDLAILMLIFTLDFLVSPYGRTWCNTLCPLGTMISILSVVNLVKPKVDKDKCTACLGCERICPMRIPLTRAGRRAMMACNKCFKCWEKCPPGAIKISLLP